MKISSLSLNLQHFQPAALYSTIFSLSNQANSEVFLVLFLACLYLDLTLFLRVLKVHICEGVSRREQHLISGLCLGEIGEGHTSWLVPMRFHFDGLHVVVALLGGFVH